MFCSLVHHITFLQHFHIKQQEVVLRPPSNISGDITPPLCFVFSKYCKNISWSTKHAFIFRSLCPYIFDKRVDDSYANLLKSGLILTCEKYSLSEPSSFCSSTFFKNSATTFRSSLSSGLKSSSGSRKKART